MAFTMEYTSTVHGVTYALTASPTSLELIGAAENGEIVAEGTIKLPPGGATEAAGLVRQALATIAIFEGKARPRVANSHARWTPDDDASLREDWLAQLSSTPATTAIRELAKARGRSPAAIRARLGRIGCDPDVAGRLLTPETAELLGRDAIAGAA